MQNLKKALTKDDVKKYQKRNMTTSFAKKAKWQDIDQLMDQKSSSKRQKNLLHQQLYTLISQAHQLGQLKDWPKLLAKLQQKYLEHHLDQDVKHDKIHLLEHIRDIIKSLQENENSIVVKKYLENCLQKIEFEIIRESKISKEASLLEFEKLLRVISKSTDKKKKPKITLGTSVSGGNLKIRFTREQYEIKNELKNKKSEGNVGSVSSNSLRRQKSEDYKSKLQNFLKDNSVKMIKTKVSYDYSAILDASKTKIQKRNNKTANPDTQKQKLHKMSNANKKNDAFIFYRPKK